MNFVWKEQHLKSKSLFKIRTISPSVRAHHLPQTGKPIVYNLEEFCHLDSLCQWFLSHDHHIFLWTLQVWLVFSEYLSLDYNVPDLHRLNQYHFPHLHSFFCNFLKWKKQKFSLVHKLGTSCRTECRLCSIYFSNSANYLYREHHWGWKRFKISWHLDFDHLVVKFWTEIFCYLYESLNQTL